MFSKDVKRVAACLVAADPKLSLRQPLNRNNNIRWPVLQPGGLWTLTPTIETSALCIITNIECFEIDPDLLSRDPFQPSGTADDGSEKTKIVSSVCSGSLLCDLSVKLLRLSLFTWRSRQLYKYSFKKHFRSLYTDSLYLHKTVL